MLRVIVESASNIPKTKFGKPDPIVSVIFKDEKKKTKKVDNELNPVWNEILEFDLRGIPLDFSSSLGIVVKDFETIGQNKLIGTATVALKDLIGDQSRSLPYKLISLLNERGQDTGATIDLVIGYDPPSAPIQMTQVGPACQLREERKMMMMKVMKIGWMVQSGALDPGARLGQYRKLS